MPLSSLQELYVEQLKDLYSAEQQITAAMPKMIQATRHQELRAGFEKHLQQTAEQIRRLERISRTLGQSLDGEECKAMKGLVEEGEHVMKQRADSDVLDAALIAAAQRIEHYEMAGYGCARTYARLLGREEEANLLQQTLDEEGTTDKLLTDMAERVVNVDALRGSEREVSVQASREGGRAQPADAVGATRKRDDIGHEAR